MKLYHFDPNWYGIGYFVMATSELAAKESLIKFLEKEAIDYFDKKSAYQKIKEFKESFNSGEIPDKYKLRVYEENEVIDVEIS